LKKQIARLEKDVYRFRNMAKSGETANCRTCQKEIEKDLVKHEGSKYITITSPGEQRTKHNTDLFGSESKFKYPASVKSDKVIKIQRSQEHLSNFKSYFMNATTSDFKAGLNNAVTELKRF
jgi:hypothetical protein